MPDRALLWFESINMRARVLLLAPAVLTFAAVLAVGCTAKVSSKFGTEADGKNPDGTNIDPGEDPEFDDAGKPPPGGCVPDPNNFDVPGNNCDDDADGTVDNVPTCDSQVAVDGDAIAFSRALGMCQRATGADDTKWGVVSAAYSNGYGKTTAPNAGQHGILRKYGSVIKPREGAALGVLSSGFAREYDALSGSGNPSFKGGAGPMQIGGGRVPPGFPKAAAGCSQGTAVFDTISVKLTIKAPKNAKGIAFDLNFHSGEWPEYVCSAYNDAFIAYLRSTGFNGGSADNMSFDASNNPVSVNNGFFDRCTPNTETGKAPDASGVVRTALCPGGEAELKGTGFGDNMGEYPGGNSTSTPGGSTGWLTSQAPIAPGEVLTLEFIIWDTGDFALDSSVLLDNLRWVPTDVVVETTRPPK